MSIKGNIIIGQSGGPTAVINSSLAGAIDGFQFGVCKGVLARFPSVAANGNNSAVFYDDGSDRYFALGRRKTRLFKRR